MPDRPLLEPLTSISERLYSTAGAPTYWKFFQGDELHTAVAAFVTSQPLTADQFALLVDYCRYWFFAPHWQGTVSKQFIDRPITTPHQLLDWINEAGSRWALDPL